MNKSAVYECDACGGQRDRYYAVVWYVCVGVTRRTLLYERLRQRETSYA
ncbi:hypothetical protein [Nostoc sp.]